MLAPCTVSDMDPVPGRLAASEMLKCFQDDPASADHAWLRLPASCPKVIITRRVPRTPCPT